MGSWLRKPTTLQRRMVMSFAFFLPVVIFLVGLALTLWFGRTTREGLIDKYRQIDAGVAGEIQMLRSNDERMMNSLAQNKMVQEALTDPAPDSSIDRYEQFRDIQSILGTGLNIGAITGIYMYGVNGRNYRAGNMPDVAALDPDSWRPYYEEALADPNAAHWHVDDSALLGDTTRGVSLFVTHAILTRGSLRGQVGVELARISYPRYENMLKYALDADGEYAFLLDEDNRVIAHTADRNAPGRTPDARLMAYVRPGAGAVKAAELGGVFVSERAAGSDWTMVHFIPDAVLRKIPTETYVFIWIVMLLSFAVMMVSLSLYASTISRPVLRLSRALRRFGEGRMSERVPPEKRRDELGELGVRFNRMADQLTEYMRITEDNHRARAKLELDVLENQINPHFLYNVLDLINWKATRAGQKDISEMAVYLARFFRLTLHMGHEFVTVSDEAEHAQAYLFICKMRYGDAFEYVFRLDPEVAGVKVKKILLQPLLENSIKYGMKPESKDNLFTVEAEDEGTHVRLAVADNGEGMDAAKLEAVRRRMTSGELSEDKGSFGLYNLYARLAFAYKDDFSLSIDSTPGAGTTVTIRVPKRT